MRFSPGLRNIGFKFLGRKRFCVRNSRCFYDVMVTKYLFITSFRPGIVIPRINNLRFCSHQNISVSVLTSFTNDTFSLPIALFLFQLLFLTFLNPEESIIIDWYSIIDITASTRFITFGWTCYLNSL